MAALTLRLVKGTPLTNAELDANFSNLNADVASRLLASSNLADLTNAGTARTNLGLGSVEDKSSATIRSEITLSNVTTALGFTPANKAGETFTGAVLTSNAGGFTANSAAKLWTDSSRGRLDLYESAAQTKSLRVMNANGYGIIGMTSAEDLELWTNGTARVTIDGASGESTFAGNILVNAGADSRVFVQSSGTTQGQFQATGSAVRLASNNALPLVLAVNGVDHINVISGGAVGIGTTALAGTVLRVGRGISGGASANGVAQVGNVQSDVTSNAVSFNSQANTAAASFTLGTYQHFLAQQGTIGAGSSITNVVGFNADATLSGSTATYGYRGQVTSGSGKWNLFMDGTASNHLAGPLAINTTFLNDYLLRVGGNMSGSATRGAVEVNSTAQSDVTSEARGIVSAVSTAAASFTVGQASAFLASQGTVGAGSAITTQVGFLVGSSFIGGATNNYGFRGAIPSGAGRWNLYMDGNAQNFLQGNLLLGASTATGGRVIVGGSISGGATRAGYINQATFQSDVTSARGFSTALSTQQASFTLTELLHFQASQGMIGSGSSITTQTGFNVESSLSGATNNYGFRGQISSGTGRWNLYMDGTADNFLAGNTGIGGSAASNARLRVIGSGASSEVARIEGGTLDAQHIINQTDDPAVNTNRAQLSLRKNNIIGATISIDGASANRGIVYYDAYSATGSHAFYVNSVDRLRINSVGAVSFSGSYGTSGHILKSGGSAGVPTWGALTSSEVTTALGYTPGTGDVTLTGTQTLTNKTISGGVYSGVIDQTGSQRSGIVAVSALDIDCSAGNYFTKTISASSTFTFSNAPASRAYGFTLELTQTSGAVTWPTSVTWPNSVVPILTAGKTHLFMFVTDDGGTTWRGASLANYAN